MTCCCWPSVAVAAGSPADGVALRDLVLGERAWISLIMRDGAARQAAWALAGGDTPPWPEPPGGAERFEGDADPAVRGRYAEVSDLVAARTH